MFKKMFLIILGSTVVVTCYALTPKDPKYCNILQEIKPKMNIGDVFVIMGPPHSFGQPPNLNMQQVNASGAPMQPQNTVSPGQGSRAQVLQSISNDPILGAFINAPPDANNVLIWTFEDNSLTVAVKVKGPIVTDVKANYTCTQ